MQPVGLGLLPLWIDLPSGEMDGVFATRRHHPDRDQSSVLLVQAPMRETDRSFSIDDPQGTFGIRMMVKPKKGFRLFVRFRSVSSNEL